MIKFVEAKFDIVKDFTEKPLGYIFSFMHGNYCSPAIRMAHKAMTSFLPDFLKAEVFKNADKLGRFNRREFCQAVTSISCRPTNSGIEILPFSDSRQSSIASFMRDKRVGISLACVWQPFIEGADAIYTPSSSFSITTVILCFSMIFILPVESISQREKGVKGYDRNRCR